MNNIEEVMRVYKEIKENTEFAGSVSSDIYLYAVETVLSELEQLQSENNKLKFQYIPFLEGELKAYKERVKELKEEIENWKFTKQYVEENYIYKDKIEEMLDSNKMGYELILMLQELLKE